MVERHSKMGEKWEKKMGEKEYEREWKVLWNELNGWMGEFKIVEIERYWKASQRSIFFILEKLLKEVSSFIYDICIKKGKNKNK